MSRPRASTYGAAPLKYQEPPSLGPLQVVQGVIRNANQAAEARTAGEIWCGEGVAAKAGASRVAVKTVVGRAGAKTLASTTITILPQDLGGPLDRHVTAGPSACWVDDLLKCRHGRRRDQGRSLSQHFVSMRWDVLDLRVGHGAPLRRFERRIAIGGLPPPILFLKRPVERRSRS